MQTDLGLLYTRALAEQVISDRNLQMDPEEFLANVSTRTGGGQLLTVTVAADTPDEALDRASALARVFLDFRAGVLTRQSEELVAGYEQQVADLTEQSDELTNQIEALQGSTVPSDVARVNELIADRAGLSNQVSQLRQNVQAEKVRVAALLGASRVVDPAAIEPGGGITRAILGSFSGAIAGFGLGVAIVIGQAIVTDRPRRRADIAACVGAPVVIGVGRVTGRRRARIRARAMAAEVISRRVFGGRPPAKGLAVLGTGSEREASAVAAELVRQLALMGLSVEVVDLTTRGRLARGLPDFEVADGRGTRGRPGQPRVQVVRPEWVPNSSHRPKSLRDELMMDTATGQGRRRSSDPVVVTVGDVDPAAGAEHFAALADVAALVLAAGAASEERLRTAAHLMVVAGIPIAFAVVTNSDGTDESIGEPSRSEAPREWKRTASPALEHEAPITDHAGP
jgi:hypothetical protein